VADGNTDSDDVDRYAVRAVLIDPGGAVFLMRFTEPRSQQGWWVTPGGGIDPGEDHLTALRREVSEELGHELPADAVGPALWRRRVLLSWNGLDVRQQETYYLVPCDRFDPPYCQDGDDETGWADAVPRWWTADELRGVTGDRVAPATLPDLLERLHTEGAPPHPFDVT
jgi:8-oxo-dGTP pyrophosphatase MutT (NUDIX family)